MKRGLALALVTLATSVVVSAQVHGVPPSVTSMGRGRGPTPGVRGSVTSLGPHGFGGGFSGNRGFGQRPGFRSRGFRRYYYPGYGYYWPYYGYYGWNYPYDYYSSDAYQQPYPQQPTVVVVDPKPDEERYGDHSFDSSQQAKAPPAPPEEQEPTLLVFRDGHQQEIRNYAIVGPMLWDFGAKGTHKIPLSDLDLDTTRKLNDERGVEFVLPKTQRLSGLPPERIVVVQ